MHAIDTIDQRLLRRKQVQFIEDSLPLVKIQTKLLSRQGVRIIQKRGEPFVIETLWDPRDKAEYDMVGYAIESLQKSILGRSQWTSGQ